MAALIVQRCNTAARAVCKLYVATTSTHTAFLARTITTTNRLHIQNNTTNHGKSKQLSSSDIKKIPDSEVRKSVFISQSNDIYSNLALEDWIYRNFDFAHHHILMLWINSPTVVIGRHQNPFAEANVSALMRNGVELARRNSGGGAVYHDLGNLNCTFFTPRARYDRKYNLNLITRALYREYGISADISDRDDITLMGKKISGTAAKLGQPNAYHHCTLLVNSNKLHLGESLVKDNAEVIKNHSMVIHETPSIVKNVSGMHKVQHSISFSPFKGKPSITFFLFKFHSFFDGLIGYESLSQLQANIITSSNTLELSNEIFPMKRLYPESFSVQINAHEQVKIELPTTVSNGDFLIEDRFPLTEDVVVLPGIYKAENNKAVILASNTSNTSVKMNPNRQLIAEMNNFK
ncbi:lipoate-protein ligase A-like [Armigeres subalbatus]|uniref:lipoate-protein ligase A-like n=1 Tax=Armigeres subalbatus TaxID=124917 RepID=UPI002ED1F74A